MEGCRQQPAVRFVAPFLRHVVPERQRPQPESIAQLVQVGIGLPFVIVVAIVIVAVVVVVVVIVMRPPPSRATPSSCLLLLLLLLLPPSLSAGSTVASALDAAPRMRRASDEKRGTTPPPHPLPHPPPIARWGGGGGGGGGRRCPRRTNCGEYHAQPASAFDGLVGRLRSCSSSGVYSFPVSLVRPSLCPPGLPTPLPPPRRPRPSSSGLSPADCCVVLFF